MKKILVVASFLTATVFSAFSQIPNPDFEAWTHYYPAGYDYEDPNGWDTPNEITGQPGLGLITVTKDSLTPHAGTYSTNIKSKFVVALGLTLPSLITNGTITVDLVNQTFNVAGGSGITGRPTSMDGFMKYAPQSVSDSAAMLAILTHYDVVNSTRDTVAIGLKYIGGTISSWTGFSVPIQYFNCNDPDSVIIVISSGNPFTLQATDNTLLTVDDISFTSGGGNAPPVANPDTIQTPMNTAVMVDVQTNDCDYEGDVMTTAVVANPGNGTAVAQVNGDIQYTPDNGYSGTDYLAYSVCDPTPGCDTTYVMIIVLPDNTAPTAVDDNAATSQSVAVTIDVQANDSDPDADPLTTTIVSNPLNGTVAVQGGDSILYTPNGGFSGNDLFTYEICDDGAPNLCDQASVTISVNTGINDPQIESYVLVYPNPSTTQINFITTYNKNFTVRIFDVVGKELNRIEISDSKNSIDISLYNAGIYSFEMYSLKNELIGKGKFVVTK